MFIIQCAKIKVLHKSQYFSQYKFVVFTKVKTQALFCILVLCVEICVATKQSYVFFGCVAQAMHLF